MDLEVQEHLKHTCPVCGGSNSLLGTIPFERNNNNVPIETDRLIDYYKCNNCSFISCPEMLSWTAEELGKEVYNDKYVLYDPDYVSTRPTSYAEAINDGINPNIIKKLKHLDYGAGSGIMSDILRSNGWDSTSYDPYYENKVRPITKFNFITAIEVVEHSLDLRKTIEDMLSFLTEDGVIVFSTLLANKSTDINWWYIGARNGHISISSVASMKKLATEAGVYFQSINETLHILQRKRTSVKDLLGWEVQRY
jgi:2-polyprenyl-6-hydroxyphenyl methylase/3-demethylubiquinone-9 3-methyltransferase